MESRCTTREGRDPQLSPAEELMEPPGVVREEKPVAYLRPANGNHEDGAQSSLPSSASIALKLFDDRKQMEKRRKNKQRRLQQRFEEYGDLNESCRQEAASILVSCSTPSHTVCWKQKCADTDEDLSLREFLLISNHIAEGTALEYPLAPDIHCSSAVNYLQRQRAKEHSKFNPKDQNWSAENKFLQRLKDYPLLQQRLQISQRINEHGEWNGARGKHSYPDWYHPLIRGVESDDVMPLQHFLNYGNSEYVWILLNYPDMNGRTLLHLAANKSSFDMVKFLITNGCWTEICDNYGKTPLHDACWSLSDKSDIILELVRLTPSALNAADDFGAVPLDYVPAKRANLHQRYFDTLRKNADDIW